MSLSISKALVLCIMIHGLLYLQAEVYSHLTIKVNVDGVQIRIDDQNIEVANVVDPVIRELNPGRYKIEANKAGYKTDNQEIVLHSWEFREITFILEKLIDFDLEKDTDKVINDGLTPILYKKYDDYEIENLVISIYDVRSPSFGFSSASINMIIQVSNPYDYTIEGLRLTYEAFINDTHVATGRAVFPDIPSNDNRKYNAGFVVSYFDLGQSIVSTIRRGEFVISLSGKYQSKNKENKFTTYYSNRMIMQ